MSQPPHGVLGLEPGASPEDVVAAYRKAALRTHPDHGGSAEAFAEVREAYLLLTDPTRLARLERERQQSEEREHLPVVCISSAMQRLGCKVAVPVPLWAPCGDCGGAGRRPRRVRRSCVECEGSGNEQTYYQGKSWVLPCRPCAGSGRACEQCPECSGQGRQLVSLEQTVRLKPGSAETVYRLDGRPAFRLRVVPLS